MTITITIPGLPGSQTSRERGHWASGARKAKAWRKSAWAQLVNLAPDMATNREVRITVALFRVYAHPRRKVGGDNLVTSMKAVRDGVADALFDRCQHHAVKPCGAYHDDDERIAWAYDQKPGTSSHVRIELRRDAARSEG